MREGHGGSTVLARAGRRAASAAKQNTRPRCAFTARRVRVHTSAPGSLPSHICKACSDVCLGRRRGRSESPRRSRSAPSIVLLAAGAVTRQSQVAHEGRSLPANSNAGCLRDEKAAFGRVPCCESRYRSAPPFPRQLRPPPGRLAGVLLWRDSTSVRGGHERLAERCCRPRECVAGGRSRSGSFSAVCPFFPRTHFASARSPSWAPGRRVLCCFSAFWWRHESLKH